MTFDWLGACVSLSCFGIPVTAVLAMTAISNDNIPMAVVCAVLFFGLVFLAGGLPWEGF